MFFVISFVLSLLTSYSATRTWSGGTSNSWSIPSNWSSGIVPTSSDDVVIGSGTTYPLVISSSVVCKSLEVKGTLTLNTGAILSITPDLYSVAGSELNITDGIMTIGNSWLGTGGNHIEGTINLSGGVINVTNDISFETEGALDPDLLNGTWSGNFTMIVGDDFLQDGDEFTITGGNLIMNADFDGDAYFQANGFVELEYNII